MPKMLFALALLFSMSLGPAFANPTLPPEIPASQLQAIPTEQKPFFLDVRDPDEIQEAGSIEGYVNIPLGQLEQRLDELPRDRPILTA